MIQINKFFLIFFIIFSNVSLSKNISVINLDEIINKNKYYIEIVNKLEINQKKYFEDFKIQEKEIEKLLGEIEEAKLILNENEINSLINNYNDKLENFAKNVDNFNSHYQNEIIKIRNSILKEIINLVEKYAKQNKIDLVMDSESYLMASNNINITQQIQEELNKIELELDFKDFEKN